MTTSALFINGTPIFAAVNISWPCLDAQVFHKIELIGEALDPGLTRHIHIL